jgi:hypothetical protein
MVFPKEAIAPLNRLEKQLNGLLYWSSILQDETSNSAANISRSGLFASRERVRLVEAGITSIPLTLTS